MYNNQLYFYIKVLLYLRKKYTYWGIKKSLVAKT